jgi:hypothetical protein
VPLQALLDSDEFQAGFNTLTVLRVDREQRNLRPAIPVFLLIPHYYSAVPFRGTIIRHRMPPNTVVKISSFRETDITP